MRVVWTSQADAMLADAVDYIAAERPSAALRWLDDAMVQTRSLAQFPDRGRMVPELQRKVHTEHRGLSQPLKRQTFATASHVVSLVVS